MKRSLIIALLLVSAACTKEKQAAKAIPKFEASEVVANEFIFSGDREAVTAYMAENGMKASLTLLDADDQFYQVRYEGKKGLRAVMAEVAPLVKSIEPNRVIKPLASVRKAEWPTDKFFFKQWALNNIGQSAPYGLPGVRGADMDVLQVWNKVTKGSDKVVVAVIDTGCDYTHPDLKENMWVNEKESPANGGVPGKDDDGNGYVDDVYGYDFVSTGRTEYRGVPGDADPMDDQGHGTHCAGAIGARSNDGIGVAGVNWKVKIMCLKFMAASGGGTTVDAYRAIRYARENGAHIMSNSWGGTQDEGELFKSELRKIEQKGILFVVAAGNDGTNNDIKPHYPSNFSNTEFRGKKFQNVLSVGASDNMDAPADFSNYGHESVDVFAPGVAIISTYPTGLVDPGRPPYAIMSGTSMATPYVAGVAALMMAANPGLIGQAAEVVRLINETADVKEGLVGRAKSNGRINAYKAVTAQIAGPKLAQIWQTKAHVVDQRGFQNDLVDIRHEIKVDGASSVKVHFDFLQIEEPYDSVYLYDKDYRLIARIEQNMVDDFWSPAIPGDTVRVRFVNSLVQKINRSPLKASSETQCSSRGATSVQRAGDEYLCNVDAEEGSDGGGSKKYTSFNSEGFRIDQVAYISDETGKGN